MKRNANTRRSQVGEPIRYHAVAPLTTGAPEHAMNIDLPYADDIPTAAKAALAILKE